MSTVLNVKIDPIVKNKAHKIAEDLGMSLSGVVNVYLRELIRTKTITASLQNEEPSESLLLAMREAQDDYANKRYVSFDSGTKAIEYLRRRRLARKSR